jgi:HSP20 family protein
MNDRHPSLTTIILFVDSRLCKWKQQKILLYCKHNYKYFKKEVIMSTKALARLSETMPSVFNDFLNPWFDDGFSGRTLNVPAVNITESKDDYLVSLAAPGLKKDDFNIDVDGNLLTISSKKEEKKEEKDARYTRKEYSYSFFERSFTLPDEVNKDKIDARYEDGLLKLILPKKEEAKKMTISKHIPVK